MSCPLQFLKLLYTGIEYHSLSVQTNLLLIPLHVQSKLRKIHGLFKKQNGNQGLFKAAQAHEILLIKHNSHSFPVNYRYKNSKGYFVKRLGLGDTVGAVYLSVQCGDLSPDL